MSLITCSDLCLGYDGRTVLADVNFTVDAGDYLCIVGENGSGKSTLIKGLLKLHPPLSGAIRMDGLRPTQIGYLPQQTSVQRDFPASVYEVVLSGRLNSLGLRPFYSKEDRRLVLEKLEMMGISAMEKHSYQELSGGQQQRVLLARALCATQKLILLDEPAAGLDPLVTQEMYALIQKINREYGITVLMVSHDIRSAVEYASHILHLGKVQLFFGTTQEYLRSEFAARFLGGEHV